MWSIVRREFLSARNRNFFSKSTKLWEESHPRPWGLRLRTGWRDRLESPQMNVIAAREVNLGWFSFAQFCSGIEMLTHRGTTYIDTLYYHISWFWIPSKSLKKCGIFFNVDFIMKVREKLYINAEIFKDYITCVFIPYFNKLQSNQEIAD
jgi:hypothetical protein